MGYVPGKPLNESQGQMCVESSVYCIVEKKAIKHGYFLLSVCSRQASPLVLASRSLHTSGHGVSAGFRKMMSRSSKNFQGNYAIEDEENDAPLQRSECVRSLCGCGKEVAHFAFRANPK